MVINHVLIRAPSGPRPSYAQISDNFLKVLSSAIDGDGGGEGGRGVGVGGGGSHDNFDTYVIHFKRYI
jgi:hypothetical protein